MEMEKPNIILVKINLRRFRATINNQYFFINNIFQKTNSWRFTQQSNFRRSQNKNIAWKYQWHIQ